MAPRSRSSLSMGATRSEMCGPMEPWNLCEIQNHNPLLSQNLNFIKIPRFCTIEKRLSLLKGPAIAILISASKEKKKCGTMSLANTHIFKLSGFRQDDCQLGDHPGLSA
ncbi:uncharacterized protein LOC107000920 [Macaca mulatta]